MSRYLVIPKDTDYMVFRVQIKYLCENYYKEDANQKKKIINWIYSRYRFFDLKKNKEEVLKKVAIAKIRLAFSSRFSRLNRQQKSGSGIKIISRSIAVPKKAGYPEFRVQINLSCAEFIKAGAAKVGLINWIFSRYNFIDSKSETEIPIENAKKKIQNALYNRHYCLEREQRGVTEEDSEEEYEEDSEEECEEDPEYDDENEEGYDDEDKKQAAVASASIQNSKENKDQRPTATRLKPNAVPLPIKQEDSTADIFEIDDDSDVSVTTLPANSSHVSNVENQDVAEAEAAVEVANNQLKLEVAKVALKSAKVALDHAKMALDHAKVAHAGAQNAVDEATDGLGRSLRAQQDILNRRPTKVMIYVVFGGRRRGGPMHL
jgi:hypothetical protein